MLTTTGRIIVIIVGAFIGLAGGLGVGSISSVPFAPEIGVLVGVAVAFLATRWFNL